MGLLLGESVAVLSAEVNFMYFGQVHNICMLIKYAPIGHLETSYAAVTSFFLDHTSLPNIVKCL